MICGKEGDIPLEHVGENPAEKEKLEGKIKTKKEREEEKRRESGSSFSLDFPAIGPSVRVGARGKVGPCIKSYMWVPKSVGFAKLRELGYFSYSV